MKNVIYENGEEFLIKKKYVKDFLKDCVQQIVENGNLEDEEIDYYNKENIEILREIEQFEDEEIICLGECSMSGYFMIYQDRVKELLGVYHNECK